MKKLLKKIESRFKVNCSKLPPHWSPDVLMSKESASTKWVIGLGRVECFSHEHNTFPMVVCDGDKLEKCLRLRSRFLFKIKGGYKKPSFLLFARFTDGDFFTKVNHLHEFKQKKASARDKSDDSTSSEWRVYIPIGNFQPLTS